MFKASHIVHQICSNGMLPEYTQGIIVFSLANHFIENICTPGSYNEGQLIGMVFGTSHIHANDVI